MLYPHSNTATAPGAAMTATANARLLRPQPICASNANALPNASTAPTEEDRWLPDVDIDDDLRLILRTFTTPRRGSGGLLYWPLDEVSGGE